MILTYRLEHGRDFSVELSRARRVAEYALQYHPASSSEVKHIGLKTKLSDPIIKKYKRCGAKKLRNVNLVVRGSSINWKNGLLKVPCLRLCLTLDIPVKFRDVVHMELDDRYAYVSVDVPEKNLACGSRCIGVDRNTGGHIVVAASPASGKVWKLGGDVKHVYNKYDNMASRLRARGKEDLALNVEAKKDNILANKIETISKKLVEVALGNKCAIKMEHLYNEDTPVSNRYSLNSWFFRRLEERIEERARKLGVPVAYIDPDSTSKQCSRCGEMGLRAGRTFTCPHCGHVDHADVNAAFQIAIRPSLRDQLYVDRDACKGFGMPPDIKC
jgi:putative transposase